MGLAFCFVAVACNNYFMDVRRQIRIGIDRFNAGVTRTNLRISAKFNKYAAYIFKTFLYLSGLGAIDRGFWLIYHPAGWIVGGAMLAYMALQIDKSTDRSVN